jgi:hypothetical protein
MNTKNQVMSIALLSMGMVWFAGCDKGNDKPQEEVTQPVRTEVSLASNIRTHQIVPKVANDQWESTDTIGFFMFKSNVIPSWDNNYACIYDNTPLRVTSNGKLTAIDSTIYYPGTGAVDFVAYYPHKPYHYSYDSLDIWITPYQTSGLQEEVLISNNVKQQTATQSTVTMTFTYALTKLSIDIHDSTFVATDTSRLHTPAEIQNMTVTVNGLNTVGAISLRNSAWRYSYPSAPIIMHKTATTDLGASFEALAIPTTINQSGYYYNPSIPGGIVIQIGTKYYKYNFPLGTTFEAAKHYHIDLSIFDTRTAVTANMVITPRTDEFQDLRINIE